MSTPKQPIRREAGQSAEEMAVQLSANSDTRLTRRKEAYPETAARLKAETVSETINIHRTALKTVQTGGQVNLDDADAVAEAADTYLDACGRAGVVPTMLGFSACLGYSRKHIYSYIGAHNNATTRFLDALRSSWAAIMASLALNRQLSEPVSIFLLKNSGQGLTDSQQYEIVPPRSPFDEIDPEAARRRIDEIVACLPEPLEGE